jgi:hypothetical protein
MSDILQIGGAVLVTLGAGLIFIPAGFIVGGILAIILGISLERK